MDSAQQNPPPSPSQPPHASSDEAGQELSSDRFNGPDTMEPDTVTTSHTQETTAQSHGSASLWRYFDRGNKMQRTNKFEANCVYCKHNENRLTRVRGEKRMMSAHLRNCHNAPPHAKSEGESIAIELKMRRSSSTPTRSYRSNEPTSDISLTDNRAQHDSQMTRHQLSLQQRASQLQSMYQNDQHDQSHHLQQPHLIHALEQRQLQAIDRSQHALRSQQKRPEQETQQAISAESQLQHSSMQGQNPLLHMTDNDNALASCTEDGSLLTQKKRKRVAPATIAPEPAVLSSALSISGKTLAEAAAAAVQEFAPSLSNEAVRHVTGRAQLDSRLFQAVPSLHSQSHGQSQMIHSHHDQRLPTAVASGTPNFFDPSQAEDASQHPGNIFFTNDGARLYYEQKGSGHALILIHGWSGSSRYFVRNFDALANSFRVIRFDLRGHGRSETPAQGFHISRLAVDLLNLMDHLRLGRVALLGCSLGCAVIWSYVELFGPQRISAALFVDQSPWQLYAADGSWRLGSESILSAESLAHLSACLHFDPRSCHVGTVKTCLTRAATPEEEDFFVGESMRAQGWFLAKLMADHTNNDWRATLPSVTCPALVIAGKRSKVFRCEGVAYAADAMPNAKLITFDQGSHWLYYEEADRFNSVVTAFLQSIIATTT